MKCFKILCTGFFIFLLIPAKTDAQFFKKLGKTVRDVANKTLADGNSTDKQPADKTATKSVAVWNSKPTNSQESSFDFSKYNISVSPAGSASFIEGEYFMENYSTIEVKDNKIFPRVVVGVLSEKERLSESSEGSENDIAHIYENGTLINDVLLNKLDKSWLDLNKKYDWYFIKDVANIGDNNKYVVASKNKMGYIISFKGKTYGPYMVVSNMIIDRTGNKFYATVSPQLKDMENQKSYLVSNDGKLKPFEFGGDLLANIDFTEGCAIISPVTALATKITKEENEARQEALQKQMSDLMMNHPNESDVIFFNGKKLINILTSSPWLDVSGKNIFSIQVDATNNFLRGLYLNGKNIADARPAQGQAWSNEDGSNWAYVSNDGKKNHLIFKDGADIISCIHPREVNAGNKTFMVWFMYDRAKSDDIKLCYKEL